MGDYLASIFSAEGFVPRRLCGNWTPQLIWLHNVSDMLIWMAYMAIPVVLFLSIRGRRPLPFRGIVVLFGLFILSCGFTHFVDVLMFYYPMYRLSGWVKAMTAVVSCATVVALVPLVPRIIEWTSRLDQRELALLLKGDRSNRRYIDYIIAVLSAVLALLIRTACDPILVDDHAFVIPLTAVILVGWNCGFGPAMFSLLIGITGTVYFFVEPRREIAVASPSGQLATVLFMVCGFATALLGESQRVAKRRAAVALSDLMKLNQELARSQKQATDALAQLDTFLAHAPVGIAFYDQELRYLKVNDYLADSNRVPAAAHVGKTPRELMPHFPEELEASLRGVLRSGTPLNKETRRYADGRRDEMWEISAYPVADAVGQPAGLVVVAQDVSERVRAERKLSENEALLRAFIDNSPTVKYVKDRSGRYTLANRAFIRRTGKAEAEIIGKTDDELFPPKLAAQFREQDRIVSEKNTAVEWEDEFAYEGNKYVMLSSKFPLPDGAVGGIGTDLTDRKRAELQLRESEERFRQIADTMPQIVWVTRPDGYHEYYNRRWYEFTGLTEAESLGEQWNSPLHPDDKPRTVARWRHSLATGEPYEIEYRFRGTDGRYRWFLGRALPVRDKDGAITRWFGTLTDIDEQRQQADDLVYQLELTRAITDNATTAIFMMDDKSRCTFANPAAEQMTGYGFAELGGQILHDKIHHHHPDGRPYPMPDCPLDRALPAEAEVRGHEDVFFRKSGEPFPVVCNARLVYKGGRPVGTVIEVRDVTAERAAAADLKESEAKLRAFYDAAPLFMGVVELTDDGDVLHVHDNAASARFLGVEAGGTRNRRASAMGVSGDTIRQWRARYEQTAATGTPVHFDFAFGGDDARWLSATVAPLGGGDRPRFCYLAEDVTARKRAERDRERLLAEVQTERRRLADVFDQAPSFMAVLTGPDHVFERANDQYMRLVGRREVLGRAARDALPEVAGQGYFELLDRVYRTGETVARQTSRLALVRTPGGDPEERFLDFVYQPLRGPGGAVEGVMAQGIDLTDRVRAEQAVKAAEEREEFVRRASGVGFWFCDLPFDVLNWDERVKDHFWLPADAEVTIGTFYERMHPADREPTRRAIDHSIGDRAPYDTYFRTVHPDTGAEKWVRAIGRAFYAADGSPRRFDGVTLDVTDRKRAEEQAKEAAERFQAMADHIPQLAWMTRPDGHIFWYNRRWYEYTGTSPESQEGWGWASVHDEKLLPAVTAKWKAALAAGEPWEDTFPLRRHDGQMRWHLSRAVPLRDDSGAIVRWFGSNTDVTEQRDQEEKLRHALARFRLLTEAIPQVVWNADAAGNVTYFNSRWREYTGRDAADDAGWLDAVHPDDRGRVAAAWAETVRDRGERFAHEMRLKQGGDGYRWFLTTAVPLRRDGGAIDQWIGAMADIDDQKRYAERLETQVEARTADIRRQQEFLDAILDNVTDGIVACDAGGRLTLFNRATREFHGLPADAALPADGWAGHYSLFEADGETPLAADRIPLVRAFGGERVRDAEMVIAPADAPVRAIVANAQPLADAAGTPLGAVCSMRDVTEERRLRDREREVMRELERSNQELEKFAYIASHDLQEPLRKVQTFGERLQTRHGGALADEGKDYLARMLDSAGRMRSLINDLLSFSRLTSKPRAAVPVDLDAVVRGVTGDLEVRLAAAGGRLDVGPLPTIDGELVRMRQVFQNLIGNALKFCRKDVPPVVVVRAAEWADLPADADPPPPAGTGWRVTVSDNGIGFDQQYADRIFEIFQRLHGRTEYPGTGIGLAIVRKIVDQHGGSIAARGRPGEGAAFIIDLPVRTRATEGR